jgi:hypothetical protein
VARPTPPRFHKISQNAEREYQAYSAQVSPIARTLALTAIAVVWLFANGRPGSSLASVVVLHRLEATPSLQFALALALGELMADLLQYLWGSMAWASYRWSLEQILLNDNFDPEDLPIRIRVGWGFARLFHIPRYFEYHAGRQVISEHPVSWPTRRSNLRESLRLLAEADSPGGLEEALQIPWAPLLINRVSLILFITKITLLILCYIFLGKFLFL